MTNSQRPSGCSRTISVFRPSLLSSPPCVGLIQRDNRLEIVAIERVLKNDVQVFGCSGHLVDDLVAGTLGATTDPPDAYDAP